MEVKMNKPLEEALGEVLREKKATIAIAESCTGGGIFPKIDYLGVSEEILNSCGAVSSETAMAMAYGIRKAAYTTFGLAVTGIAGPGGGTPEKPVGLVFIALAGPKGIEVTGSRFDGERVTIKVKTAEAALTWLLSEAKKL